MLAVLGPNGAGKTSTVETLEGYRRPAAGTVRVLGLDPLRRPRRAHRPHRRDAPARRRLPDARPAPGPRPLRRLLRRPRPTDELLDLVGLRAVAATPWRQLSGGEQQRLSLALALVGRPEVAFLDEPTAGVDPEGRLAIREVVADLRDQGRLRAAHHPRAGRGREDGRPRRDLSAGRVVLEGTPPA